MNLSLSSAWGGIRGEAKNVVRRDFIRAHILFFTDIIPLDAMFYAYIIKSLDVEKKIRDTPIVSELIPIF